VSTDRIERTVRRFYDEVVGQGKVELIDEFTTPDFVEHEEFAGLPPTREGVKQFVQMWRAAFPDARAEITKLVVDGNDAAIYATWSGTHEADFMGMPATGKRFSIAGADFVSFTDEGLVAEHWGVTDTAAMMEQLGLAPPVAAGAATT
jgi:steroid delta-isomerase-like uncharacterized protein